MGTERKGKNSVESAVDVWFGNCECEYHLEGRRSWATDSRTSTQFHQTKARSLQQTASEMRRLSGR